MAPRLRKFTLTAHVTSSVGWLGAVVAYLVLAVVGLSRQDPRLAGASYLAMDVVGWFVIVPLCCAALATGIVQSLGTQWGLFRHYWIVAKLALTVAATAVLLFHLPTVTHMAQAASETTLTPAALGPTRVQLVVHAGGGLLVLLTTTTLSIYKPWGRTPYGRRKALQPALRPRRAAEAGEADMPADRTSRGRVDVAHTIAPSARAPWRKYVILGLIGMVLLFLVLHLAGGGMRH